MPYGVSKSEGGDSAGNTAWMERCVASVQKSGRDKVSAIRICKAQLSKSKGETRAIASRLRRGD